MRAADVASRVGVLAAALGIGAAILGGAGVAVADTDGSSPAVRGSAVTSADSTAGATRSARSARAVAGMPAAASPRRATAAVVPDRTSSNVTQPVSRAELRVASRAPRSSSVTAAVVPTPSPTPPSPDATVTTAYGVLGEWMLNKAGEVANWLGQPYCGAGSTTANCTSSNPNAKTLQEPINTIFVVQAHTEYGAKLKLDLALRLSGFGPSCCSSIGYRGIVGPETDPQLPTGGLLGLGILPPLPFGLGQRGLLGLIGFGPAYRNAPFFLANSHLRVFGAESDGNGNYVFTGSVSEENLDASSGGLLPTHGYESFLTARTALTTQMLGISWLTGASDGGMVAMNNAIAESDPTYTTGDHDGLAQVIMLGAMVASSPARSARF